MSFREYGDYYRRGRHYPSDEPYVNRYSHRGSGRRMRRPEWTSASNLGVIWFLLCLAGVGFICLLNVQPWMVLAKQAVLAIKVIPFANELANAPFGIGSFFGWLFKSSQGVFVILAEVLGICLWAAIQFVECLSLFLELSPRNIPVWLVFVQGGAYLLEAIVCFIIYPPYIGGMDAFLADLTDYSLDIEQFDWWNVVLYIITLVGVEAAVVVSLKISEAIRKGNRRLT